MTIRRIAIMMIAVLCVLSVACTKRMVLSGDSIEIERYETHMSNYHQYSSPVWIGVIDDELFFYFDNTNTDVDGWLCKLSNGSISKITQLERASILGISGQCVVYQRYKESEFSKENPGLYCVDTQNGNIDFLLDGVYTNPGFYTENGMLQFMSIDGDTDIPSRAATIDHGRILDANGSAPCYCLNHTEYCLIKTTTGYNSAGGPHSIYYRTEGADAWRLLDLSYADRLTILPVQEGLLIHAYGGSKILYYIQNDGTIIDLFDTDYPYTQSAVAIHDSDVYISFQHVARSGKWEIQQTHYDDEGTYRIHLTDFKTEHLCHTFYPGLYIFNDQYFVTCDEAGNLRKMDLEGNDMGSFVTVE